MAGLNIKKPDLYSFLSNVPLLRELDDSVLKQLEQSCSILKIPKGKVIFLQGEPSEAVYIVKSGVITEYVFGPKELEMIISERRITDFFGEMSILIDESQVVTTIASQDSILVAIPKNHFILLLQREPKLSYFLLKQYAHWLIRSGGAQVAYANLDAKGKLAYLILTLERDGGSRGAITISQGELARNCGLVRQTVARILGEWKDSGWLSTRRGGLELIDCAALTHVIETSQSSF